MLTLPTMSQVIAWFGWGHGVGALAGISAILTMVVIVAPVIAGLLLYGLERAQVELIGQVNRDFAYFFVNFVTFPGTFVHEMAHLCFGVITGAGLLKYACSKAVTANWGIFATARVVHGSCVRCSVPS